MIAPGRSALANLMNSKARSFIGSSTLRPPFIVRRVENPWHGGHPARRSSSPGWSRNSFIRSVAPTDWMSFSITHAPGWFSRYVPIDSESLSTAARTLKFAQRSPRDNPPQPQNRSIAVLPSDIQVTLSNHLNSLHFAHVEGVNQDSVQTTALFIFGFYALRLPARIIQAWHRFRELYSKIHRMPVPPCPRSTRALPFSPASNTAPMSRHTRGLRGNTDRFGGQTAQPADSASACSITVLVAFSCLSGG